MVTTSKNNLKFKNLKLIRKAIQIYEEMMREKDYDKNYHVYKVNYKNRHAVYTHFARMKMRRESVLKVQKPRFQSGLCFI